MKRAYRDSTGAASVPIAALPVGPFDVLVADPPWSYGAGGGAGAVSDQYPSLTVSQIASIPVPAVMNKPAICFLWVTNPKLSAGFDVLSAWGFAYKTTLTWVKTTKAGDPLGGGLGYYFRGATEHVLVGTRGQFSIPPHLRESNVIMAQRGRHSQKPNEFYDLVARVTPGMARLEMFARSAREGFNAWGTDAP